jgi:tripartite-type tricarboxylate transporter receptor subunit TctC
MFAPAATPKPVLDTLNQAILKAMQAPPVKETFAKQYFNIVPSASADEAKTWLAGEIANWRKTTQEVKLDIPD